MLYDNAAEPPHRCGEGSWSTLNVMNEVRRTGSANPVRLSMESCGSAPRSAAGRKKAHSHTQPCAKEKRTAKAGRAQITLRASASGMAKAQEQRIAYLTYPVRAGITVTFSRGLSPHSAASRKTSAPSCYSVLYYCTTCRGKLQEGICPAAVFFIVFTGKTHPFCWITSL